MSRKKIPMDKLIPKKQQVSGPELTGLLAQALDVMKAIRDEESECRFDDTGWCIIHHWDAKEIRCPYERLTSFIIKMG